MSMYKDDYGVNYPSSLTTTIIQGGTIYLPQPDGFVFKGYPMDIVIPEIKKSKVLLLIK